MHPILFESGSVTIYSYGFLIALGVIAGMTYLIIAGRKETGLTFDQANMLFLSIFAAAVIGGKLFLFLEDPLRYIDDPRSLFTGRGFVFYGSFLLAIPTMWLFFRKQKLHPYKMLDVMAVTTCLVHMFGRIGCFLAGCCYGIPTDSSFGVVFTDARCYAEPLNTPLFPIQLLEASWILLIMILLLFLRKRRRFYGQLFLTYLMLYGVGRFILEFFRGDAERGFVLGNHLSHSQLIAICMTVIVLVIFVRWSKRESVKLR